METISIAIKNFNNKVKVMNQTNGRQLILSAEEARNLHSDIYNLLANFAELQSGAANDNVVQINLDGGGFK